MADITTHKIADTEVPLVEGGALYPITLSFTAASDLANDGDLIEVFTAPVAMTIFDASLDQSATLGAGAVVALWAADAQITGDTTAGAASFVQMNRKPISLAVGDKVEIESETADFTASAVLTATVLVRRD